MKKLNEMFSAMKTTVLSMDKKNKTILGIVAVALVGAITFGGYQLSTIGKTVDSDVKQTEKVKKTEDSKKDSSTDKKDTKNQEKKDTEKKKTESQKKDSDKTEKSERQRPRRKLHQRIKALLILVSHNLLKKNHLLQIRTILQATHNQLHLYSRRSRYRSLNQNLSQNQSLLLIRSQQVQRKRKSKLRKKLKNKI